MDPNPKSFPILSYVMSKIPSMSPRQTAGMEFDIENPQAQSQSPKKGKEPAFDLTERMPQLTDPKLIASMRAAVSEVHQARSVLKTLGERPDHETIDAAKAKLKEIEDELSKELEEIVLTPRPEEVDRIEWRAKLVGKEMERRTKADQERQLYKTVISLDEMHDQYEKMLSSAEARLEKIYAAAVAGHDLAEEEGSSGKVAEEVNEEVVGILQEAAGRGIERIDLSGRMLRLIPEAFGHLQGLVALNLASNQLEAIPDSIGGLENLEELILASNTIQSLPDTIGLLLKLKFLDVSGNKLVALPDSICQCRSLVELDASFNKLTYLPTNIGFELVNLKRLSVQLNKIRSLPTSIGEMQSLSILDVHFNELHGLPATIGRLTSLESLNLSSNFSDMKELPETFGDLINLKELDLSNNQIQALPDSFGRLENIVKLNLEENPLVVPPKEVVAKGVEAVKIFMSKRWLDVLVEEDRKSKMEAANEEPTQTGWLTRSTSWLNTVATGVTGYLGNAEKSPVEAYLNQQL